jgi:preprotein translocase subunit SecG
MTILIASLIILTCILLVIIVLIQNPKGGGLSSSFGGSGTQMFGGVKKTTDFLDKGTWTLSIVLVVLVLAANVLFAPQSGATEQQESEVLGVEVSSPSVNNFDADAFNTNNSGTPATSSGTPATDPNSDETVDPNSDNK